MPTNLVRQLLRTSVLKTNAYWPFGNCSRLLYAAAIKAFVFAFRRQPEICRIYLRNGMTAAEWIPALSDIDLTVIVRNNLSDQEEYDFLERFWTVYRSLRFVFPMLGEVEILDEKALAPWLAYSSCSPQKRRWVLLHGAGDASFASDGSRDWQRRTLNYAIWVYLDLFVPCFSMPDSFIHRQDVQRRARKILRLLQPILSEAGECTPHVQHSDPTNLMVDVLVALETAIDSFVASDSGSELVSSTWHSAEPDRRDVSPSLRRTEGVHSVIILKDKQVWVVLKDGLKRNEICRVIQANQCAWPGTQTIPVLLPSCLFAHIVRHYYPFAYFNLLEYRIVAFGADPLAQIAPPDRAALVTYTLKQIPSILTYARGEEQFSPTRELSLPLLEKSLNWALAVRLLLRDDSTCASWDDVAAQCRSTFPECFRALEEIESHVAHGRNKLARRAFFCLFRSVTTDIQNLLVDGTLKQRAVGEFATYASFPFRS